MMRYLLAAALVAAVGCSESDEYQDVPYGCGGAYHSKCSTHEVCVDDHCEICGGQGQQCCDVFVDGGSACDDPLAQCVGISEAVHYCDSTCGSLGLDCCQTGYGPDCSVDEIVDGELAAVTCDVTNNECVHADACWGDTPHFVELIGPDHCVLQPYGRFEFESDTPESCVAEHIAASFPGASVTAGPLDVEAAIEDDFCTNQTPYHLRAMTAADLVLCEQTLCPGCTWTECP